jgi:hypothetical protein
MLNKLTASQSSLADASAHLSASAKPEVNKSTDQDSPADVEEFTCTEGESDLFKSISQNGSANMKPAPTQTKLPETTVDFLDQLDQAVTSMNESAHRLSAARLDLIDNLLTLHSYDPTLIGSGPDLSIPECSRPMPAFNPSVNQEVRAVDTGRGLVMISTWADTIDDAAPSTVHGYEAHAKHSESLTDYLSAAPYNEDRSPLSSFSSPLTRAPTLNRNPYISASVNPTTISGSSKFKELEKAQWAVKMEEIEAQANTSRDSFDSEKADNSPLLGAYVAPCKYVRNLDVKESDLEAQVCEQCEAIRQYEEFIENSKHKPAVPQSDVLPKWVEACCMLAALLIYWVLRSFCLVERGFCLGS